jgi:O-antigen ligase
MIVGYYQFFTGAGGMAFEGISNRAIGTLGMANAFGIFLALCLCGTIYILQFEKNKLPKLSMVIILISIIISSFLALNRGTWIAFTIAVFFSSFAFIGEIKTKWIIIAGISIAIVFSGLILSRFQQLEETEPWQRSNTMKGRVEIWKAAISLVPTHPVVGHGIGTAQLVTLKYEKINAVPHNDYIRLLLEIGIPGVALYVFFLAKIFMFNVKMIFRNDRTAIYFPALICITYWIIISGAQNIIYNLVNFPLFLALVAINFKWERLYT